MGENPRTVLEILDHYIREFEETLKQPEVWDDTERRVGLQAKVNLLEIIKLHIELEGTEVVR